MDLQTLRNISFILGIFLLTLAVSMVIPVIALFLFEHGADDMPAFLWSVLITASCGLLMLLPGRPKHSRMRSRDMYLLTAASWIVVCVFAALPMMLIRNMTYTDAFFETMSGITTTGSTVLSDLDDASPGLLLWRSLLHWLGGIGFIGMAIAVLPMLRIGGMKLFRTESSDWSEKVMPRSHIVAKYLFSLYIAFTLIGWLALWLTGMSSFDAINHAMSAVATGGFSTSDDSLGHFPPATHWVVLCLMLTGSLPFALYISVVKGNIRPLLRDQQVKGFLLILVSISTVLTLWLWFNSDYDFLKALRVVCVSVVSTATTTGLVVEDYSLWGNFAFMTFFYLAFVGGCSGSTTGGIKIFRFQVAYRLLQSSLKQLIHPRATIYQKYNGHPLDEEIVRSILTFSFFFAITIGCIALLLTLLGIDFITALTGAISAVCNSGVGLGPIIGPSGNFASLPDSAKWILSFGMLLGRLEIITILVLLTPAFWRY